MFLQDRLCRGNGSNDEAILIVILPINNQLASAYVSASTGAVVTALGLKSLAKRLPAVMSRFVPFFAVAAVNCINIPFMRQRAELRHPSDQWELVRRVSQSPRLPWGRKPFIKWFPVLNASVQVGLCLVFATPLCCTLSPYTSTVFLNKGLRTTQ
uniref:Sideroflexin-3 n=1 Tax=Hucho hucho TaxID=62062 RepID=A0A4W5PTL1_9TELE